MCNIYRIPAIPIEKANISVKLQLKFSHEGYSINIGKDAQFQ